MISPLSSPSPLDDWDSDHTVMNDEDRRWWEKREHRQSPKTEYEQEQFSRIRQRIQEMVGQENQHAEVYKGAEDIMAIAKYVELKGIAEK